MFRSIIPTTVGLNNSKYVHANIDEEYELFESNDSEVKERNKTNDEATSPKHILSASNSYNIKLNHLENCKTPEELALKILKSQNFQNKRKYTNENLVLCEKKKKTNTHVNNEQFIYSTYGCPHGRYSSSSSLGRQTTQTSNLNNFSFYKAPPDGYMYNRGSYSSERRLDRDMLPLRNSSNYHGYVDKYKRLSGTYGSQQTGFSNIQWCHNRCEEMASAPPFLSTCNHIDQRVINEMDKMKVACKYQFSTLNKFDKIGISPGRSNIFAEPPHWVSKGIGEAYTGGAHKEGAHYNAIDVEAVYDHLSSYNPPKVEPTDEEPIKKPPSDDAALQRFPHSPPTKDVQAEGTHTYGDPPDGTTLHVKGEGDKQDNPVSILANAKEGDEHEDPSQEGICIPDMPKQKSVEKKAEAISQWRESAQIEGTAQSQNTLGTMDDMQIKEVEAKWVELARGESEQLLEGDIIADVEEGAGADAEGELPRLNDPNENANKGIEYDMEKSNDRVVTHYCDASIQPIDNNRRWVQLEQHMDSFLSINSSDINRNKKMKRIVTSLEGCLKNDKHIVYDEGSKVELVLEKIFANVKEFLSKEICYRRGRKRDMELSLSGERTEESRHAHGSGTYSNVEDQNGTEDERDEVSQSGSDTHNRVDEEDETLRAGEGAHRSRSKGSSKDATKNAPQNGPKKDGKKDVKKDGKKDGKKRGPNNSRSAKQPNEAVMTDLIYGHYNILLYLILLKFECFKKYVDTEEINEQVLINLKINFKNVILKLCQCEIKNRVIQFYHVHETYLVQLNWVYEKCLLYLSDLYMYIEEYDTVLVNLLDLCTLTLQTNYNVQNIILNSSNLLLRLFRNQNRKKMKKYVLDDILSNINNVNFRYNKLTFRNSQVNSTYIHLITFLLIKIAESFSHYEGDLKRKYILDQQRGGGSKGTPATSTIHNRFDSETDNDDEDDDEYYVGKCSKETCNGRRRNRSRHNGGKRNTGNAPGKKDAAQSDQSRSLSIFTSEDEDNSTCSGEPTKNSHTKGGKKKCTTGRQPPRKYQINTKKEKPKYSLRKKTTTRSYLYHYDYASTTHEYESEEKNDKKRETNINNNKKKKKKKKTF
ncbi:hypothetical protein AK88_04093 [Plasmodium fragile]|uniref:Uncharacterized protein n=1 Tax=Plasmodium fragile TaxID=5857 RepID=A0A0D9QGZ1_PLAFR|nr:uncharacterized protein AK88_04093 [Plasmodium fragile]KJP86279.1 hypothetical protein AK88_04093 [Plasmodium fragile]